MSEVVKTYLPQASVLEDLARPAPPVGRSTDSRQRSRQLLVDQMCQLTGGPCHYIGRDMRTSHAGLGITTAEWEANLAHTAAALDRNGIREPEKAEFLVIFERFRGEIVEAPHGRARFRCV